jgi:hypothetical protein
MTMSYMDRLGRRFCGGKPWMSSKSPRLVFALALATALLASGCNAALIGNVFVLLVTVGIFFGTLGLGRASARSSEQSASADRSGSGQQR